MASPPGHAPEGAPFYRAPWWLSGRGMIGGNAQTIWAALLARPYAGPAPAYRRERWTTPDGDFVDTDWLDPPTESAQPGPLLVLFHGLEGSSRSHYALAFADWARAHGWHLALPHFRGCSGELNRAPRAYHSGDHEEIGWMLAMACARHRGPTFAVGVSLGGNALLRWAQEAGEQARATVQAIAAICSPIDLASGGWAISRGFNRQVYARMFLRSMKPKALAKLAQHPGLFDREALLAARDLHAFDNAFTAPVHGFRDALDYWTRASALPHLARLRVPALIVNARNDPFVPVSSLPTRAPAPVRLWQPEEGGHVGFPQGRWPPGDVRGLPEQVMRLLKEGM